MQVSKKNQILDKELTLKKINRIAYEIWENNFTEKEIILAGVAPGGMHLAHLLINVLTEISDLKVKLIKISLDKNAPLQSEITLDCDLKEIENKAIVLVDDVLNNLESHFPEYNSSNGYEIAGLVWHQGWSDHGNASFTAQYTENLANLIKDLREDIGVNFPVVVATTAVNTLANAFEENTIYKDIELAQLAIANTNEYPEFEGNVTVLDAKPYWISPDQSPIPGGEQHFHWNQNAKSYMDLGFGVADALYSTESFSKPSTNTAFVPDPNKTYYIDSPHYNVRVAATGESNDAYTTSTSTTGADVEWRFVAKGNGFWHIQRAAGGTRPRLRRDNSFDADMQETTSTGAWTYYEITPGEIAGSYFLTLPDAPTTNNRLQINNAFDVKTVSSAGHNGTWESFVITEASAPSFEGTIHIEAEDFDAMNEVRLQETDDDDTLNVGWINTGDWMEYEVNVPVTGAYNIDARVATRNTGAIVQLQINGTNAGVINIDNTGGWQEWTTERTTINLTAGIQTIRFLSVGDGYNINWFELELNTSSAKFADEIFEGGINLYPVPVINVLNLELEKHEDYYGLNIYNSTGELVLSNTNISSNTIHLDISNLQNGIYFLNIIRKDGKLETKKFVK